MDGTAQIHETLRPQFTVRANVGLYSISLSEAVRFTRKFVATATLFAYHLVNIAMGNYGTNNYKTWFLNYDTRAKILISPLAT